MEWLKASCALALGMKALLLACVVLLAGCAGANQPSSSTSETSSSSSLSNTNPPGFAVQSGHSEGEDGTAPGLLVVADMRVCEAGFCIHATANNSGPATYQVSNICVPPWSDTMTRDGKTVQHKEPMASCMAFGTGPMAPGTVLHANFTWDQTVWENGKAEPAPQGMYEWTITFTAYEGTGGDGRHDIRATVHVIVGET